MINQNAKLKEICSLLLEEVIWEKMKEVKIHKAKIEKLESQKFMHQKQVEELRKLSTKSENDNEELHSMTTNYVFE